MHKYLLLEIQAVSLVSTFLVAGCAGVTSIANREIQENKIAVNDFSRAHPPEASVLGMSENRRGILVRDNSRLPDGTPKLYFCAEPPPDVAMSTRAGVAWGIAATTKGEAKVSDEYSRLAMQLSNRTSLLDIYRTAVFSLCQMHMNGAISHPGAESIFREITLEALRRSPLSDPPGAVSQSPSEAKDLKSSSPRGQFDAYPQVKFSNERENDPGTDATENKSSTSVK